MGWMNGVKRALNQRGMSVEQGRMIVHDRSESRAMVNAKNKDTALKVTGGGSHASVVIDSSNSVWGGRGLWV